MNLIDKIKENAKKANKRIVLAEGEEELLTSSLKMVTLQ